MNLQKMTKQQLKKYGESIGTKLDLKRKILLKLVR